MTFLRFVVVGLMLAINLEQIVGHGMMLDPVSRSSAWRKGFNTPRNYNDNEQYCGGFKTQFEQNKGKCGECGDNYADPRPRANENGGTYGTGTIVRTYKAGSVISITVKLTANHMGYFEFTICPLISKEEQETEECFQRYTLKLANGLYKYELYTQESREYTIRAFLPDGLTCERCVLRWHYRAANNWGVCNDGTKNRGCGNQETFRNCADVSIHA